jgi:hypothetical protein
VERSVRQDSLSGNYGFIADINMTTPSTTK